MVRRVAESLTSTGLRRALKSKAVCILVKSGAECTMTLPTPEKIRLTITVSAEVHDTFSRMAAASGTSLGRTMGEWLGDTRDAAEAMALMLEKARQAPRQAMREMHSYALGLTDATSELLDRVRDKERSESSLARDAAAQNAPPPRPVIRGGKSIGKGQPTLTLKPSPSPKSPQPPTAK